MADTIEQPLGAPLPPVQATPKNLPAELAPKPVPQMSSSEAAETLARLNVDASQLFSAANVTQAITNPAPVPTDIAGIGAWTNQKYNVDALKAESFAAKQLYESALPMSQQRKISISKATGIGEKIQEQLRPAYELAQENYLNAANSAKEEARALESELSYKRQLQTQFIGAGIKATDSIDQAMKKAEKYVEKKEKKEYKDKLKEALRALGKSTSGSRNELEKRLAKANKSELAKLEEERQLKLEAARIDIANTKSLMAERGREANEPEQNKLTSVGGGYYQDSKGNIYINEEE